MTTAQEADRIKSRLWYQKRKRQGKCCECAADSAVTQILQQGKVMEQRVMANCYRCLSKRRGK